MTCFHPLEAWQTDAGDIVFAEVGKIRRDLLLPCGKCYGCRLTRARNWAVRLMHESQMHPVSSFVTLTYEENPIGLDYGDYQLFMKRFRRAYGPTRFFAVGEYGDKNLRPHFHAMLFGQWFPDRKKYDATLYTSAKLDKVWSHGGCKIGNLTFQSAAYVARYCIKKTSGYYDDWNYARMDADTGEYFHVEKEMAHMSLRPAIGYTWFQRYWREVYAARDGVIVDGKRIPAPKYYDKLLERTCPDLKDEKDLYRYFNSKKYIDDTTPERLAVREAVAGARLNLYKRSL